MAGPQKGIDFQKHVDLGGMFKTCNPCYDNYSYFSLKHEANRWHFTLIRFIEYNIK